MSDKYPIIKDENKAHPIPSRWRKIIANFIDHLVDGDNKYKKGKDIILVSKEDVDSIYKNIESYGVSLKTLPEESWTTSQSQWMVDYWEILVDLYSNEEGRSDLVLSATVFERDGHYEFENISVYVP